MMNKEVHKQILNSIWDNSVVYIDPTHEMVVMNISEGVQTKAIDVLWMASEIKDMERDMADVLKDSVRREEIINSS